MEDLISLTDDPFVSVILWMVLIILAMYAARKPFLRSILSMSRLLYNSTRLAATSVRLAEKRLQYRNREVLIAAELEMGERRIERELDRIGIAFQRHMEVSAQVQRKLTEDLIRNEEDYRNCVEVPQVLPDYARVIDAVANIKPSGDPAVINILAVIHNTLAEQHKITLERYRRSVAERHAILGRMVPFWRSVQKSIRGIEQMLSDLNLRSKKIDRYMDDHHEMLGLSDAVERRISSSSLIKLILSITVLAVAGVVAIINYNLVALPMSEMVGGNSYIGNYKTSDVAAFLIVSLEVVLGFFIMDALGITRLFSVIGSLEERKRKAVFWVLCCFLLALAGIESALALLWDRVAAQMRELHQTLAGESNELLPGKIAMIGQMIMGFILPLLLAFVAIPFETFISSLRTVLGMSAAWSLRALAFGLRLLGNLSLHSGRMATNIYDLVIFPALWVEGAIARRIKAQQNKAVAHEKDLDGRITGAPQPQTRDY